MQHIPRKIFFLSVLFGSAALHAKEASYGISGNPAAVNIMTSTGELGKLMQIPEKSGVRLGGVWLGDYNALACRVDGKRLTGNSSFILDLYIDFQKAFGWKGASFGSEFLQFYGQPTNKDAGVVQGYNSLPGSPPLNRSELYQLWLRQEFLDNKLSIRAGKTVPSYHFNNVSKPVPTTNPAVSIPSVTGLIYTPIFVNRTLDGVLGGYYNSVYEAVATIALIKQAHVNLGFFDRRLVKGVQAGLTGPRFNGY
jgi:porin